MLIQFALGALIIWITIVFEALFIEGVLYVLETYKNRFFVSLSRLGTIFAIALVTIWLMLSHMLGIWVWSFCFLAIDAFSALEESLYFSSVCFTTLGFGDILLPQEWRLLSGACATNGLLLFGVSTAFLVEFMRRLRLMKLEN